MPDAPLLDLPTPLVPAPRFSALIGAEIWIKRDDAGPPALAGNKVRKLMPVLGTLSAEGAEAVVMQGAQQSNACRATAAACARLGLRCVLVLTGDPPAQPAANLMLSQLLGAELRFAGTSDWAQLDAAARETAREIGGAVLPLGVSSPEGAGAFAHAYAELLAQLDELGLDPEVVVHASTSGGTHAGLLLGHRLAGRGPRPLGVAAARDIAPDMPAHHAQLATDAATALGYHERFEPGDVELDMDWVGPGYGIPTPECIDAIRLLAQSEAILCDPVYSGKALAALVAMARAGRFDGRAVFWHTGGWHALFEPGLSAAAAG